MTQAVWKFPVSLADTFSIDMPKGAKVLSLQVQNGVPCMWVLCPTKNKPELRTFRVFGTGHPIEDVGAFVGTFQVERGGSLVFHVFESAGGRQ